MWKATGGIVLAWALAAAVRAAPLGMVTLTDGRAHLARATSIYAVADGVAVEEGDILELEDGALVQIEFNDGSALSLTSGARAMLPMPAAAGGKAGDALLAGGWAKLGIASPAQLPAFATPQLRLLSQPAVYVITADAEGTRLFVESGEVVPVFAASGAGQPAVLKGNDFASVKPDNTVATGKGAPPAFVKTMPRLYMDKLPKRVDKLKARGVPPKPEREAGFADLNAWAGRFPAARAVLLERFRPMLADENFRRELEPAIANFPEWAAQLKPQKGRAVKGK